MLAILVFVPIALAGRLVWWLHARSSVHRPCILFFEIIVIRFDIILKGIGLFLPNRISFCLSMVSTGPYDYRSREKRAYGRKRSAGGAPARRRRRVPRQPMRRDAPVQRAVRGDGLRGRLSGADAPGRPLQGKHHQGPLLLLLLLLIYIKID